MLVFVTGVAGSGKSTLCRRLRQLGAQAHDADDGISRHVRLPGGDPVPTPPRTEQTARWAQAHEYRFDLDRVRRLAAGDEPAFLLGSAYGDDEVIAISAHAFFLDLPEEELRRRLADRGPGAYGSAGHELESILTWHAAARERYEGLGAIPLDATAPAERLAAGLIALTGPGAGGI